MPDFTLFDRNRPIIVAASGGPDSMALAHMLYEQGFDLILAHVNYHQRESALRDQQIVEQFARERNLIFEIKDYPKVQAAEKKSTGNFQAQARDFRYDFFFDLARKYQSDQIALAHHLDDLLETYLMQKERKAIPSLYGLAKERRQNEIRLIRPLLDLSKADLEAYCKEHSIQYGIDESNLSDHYLRNRIRHHVLSSFSQKEKEELLKEIEEENLALLKEREKAKSLLSGPIEDWIHKEEAWFILTMLVLRLTGQPLSRKQAEEELKKLEKGWLEIAGKRIFIYQNHLYLSALPEAASQEVVIQDPKQLQKLFEQNQTVLPQSENLGKIKAKKTGKKIENLRIEKEDFPLTLRPARQGDEIVMRYGAKKLSRFFIDRKIPMPFRNSWPVIENSQGQIIYVFGLGADKAHFDLEQGIYLESPFENMNKLLKEYAIII